MDKDVMRPDLPSVLGAALPADAAYQDNALRCARRVLGQPCGPMATVLDLGCGEGGTIDLFRELSPGAHWIGLDIEASPEVAARRRSDGDFRTYDGVNIPLDDNSVDLVFTCQAFEHVHYPHDVIRQVARILRPGGRFIGSTSHLEPYHSFSTFGYTPHGWKLLVEQAGMELLEIRPGVDALSMLLRRAFGASPRLRERWYYGRSPVHALLDAAARLRRWPPRRVNAVKLRIAGMFTFIARKPETP